MISELIVTSAPRGLQAGRSGFTTVCRTRGIHPDLASRLEAASGYRHVFPQGDPRNPVIFSFTNKASAVGDVWVMSRVGDAGTDYTGRSNKIAHHVAMSEPDLAAFGNSNPAAVMAALAAGNGLLSRWEGDPHEKAAPPHLPAPRTDPALCRTWAAVAGDAGWAGVLAQRALQKEPTWVIATRDTDVLALFSEALALVGPGQRWTIPFTTYSLRGDEGLWLAAVAGSPEADAARAQKRIAVVDLTRPGAAPPTGPYVTAARGAAPAPWQRQANVPLAHPRAASGPAAPGGTATDGTAMPASLPPALVRPAGGLHRQPPDGSQWVASTPEKPDVVRLALAASLVVVAAFVGLAAAYGAYRFRCLPDAWRHGVDEWAWRTNSSLFEQRQPQALTDAEAQRMALENARATLQRTRGERLAIAVPHHPGLRRLLEDSETHLKELGDSLTTAGERRDFDAKHLANNVGEARRTCEEVNGLLNDEQRLDKHLEAAVTLGRSSSEARSDGPFTEARRGLEACVQDLTATALQIDEFLRRFPQNPPATPAPAADAKQAAEAAPLTDVSRLLLAAIEKQKHRPTEGLDASQPGGTTFTLARWQQPADPASLAAVTLSLPSGTLPDGRAYRLELEKIEPTSTGTAEAQRAWVCISGTDSGPDAPIGRVILGTGSLTFTGTAPERLKDSLVPFLPLMVECTITSTTTDTGTAAPITNWLQLVTPRKIVVELTGTGASVPLWRAVATSTHVPDAVARNMRFKNCALSVVPPSGAGEALEIASASAAKFGDRVDVGELGVSPEEFVWRLRASGTFLGQPSMYRDRATASLAARVVDDALCLTGTVTFDHRDHVRDAAKTSTKNVREFIDTFAKNLDEFGVSGRDWRLFCRDTISYSGIFKHPAWRDRKPTKRIEDVDEVWPEQEEDRKPFTKRLDDLRHLCVQHEDFTAFAEQRAEKETARATSPGQKPVKPKVLPDNATDDEKAEQSRKEKEYDIALKKWNAASQAWDAWVEARDKEKNDIGTLAAWAELQIQRSDEPTQSMFLAAAWLSAYRFAVKRTLPETLQDVETCLKDVRLRMTGDVVVAWAPAVFGDTTLAGGERPTILIATMGDAPDDGAPSGSPDQPATVEPAANGDTKPAVTSKPAAAPATGTEPATAAGPATNTEPASNAGQSPDAAPDPNPDGRAEPQANPSVEDRDTDAAGGKP